MLAIRMLCVDGGLGNGMSGQNCEAIVYAGIERGSVAMCAFLMCRDPASDYTIRHFLFRKDMCDEICRSKEFS